MPHKEQARPSVDGFSRTNAQEAHLNELAVATFGRGKGREFLDYLKNITGAAFDEHATEGQLRHANGQRALVSMIDARIARGNKQRSKVK